MLQFNRKYLAVTGKGTLPALSLKAKRVVALLPSNLISKMVVLPR